MRSERPAIAVAAALGLAAGLAVAAEPTVATPPTAPPAPTFLSADPAHAWSFPRDHFARPGYRNEWWYFTGIVTAADGRRFGFQVTFFKVGLLPTRPPLASAWAAAGAVMVHAAVTDLATGRHHFTETLWRDAPLLAGLGTAPGAQVAWAQAPPGTPGRWTLDLDGDGWHLSVRDDRLGLALALAATPTRPLVLQGPNGYSRKSPLEGYASEYYSQTRLAVEGTLALGGAGLPARGAAGLPVKGTAWMDREVGSSQLAPGQVGWDWFALRLKDGRDLMLYLMRRADGAVDWRSGSLVASDGTVTPLAPGSWSVRPTGRWRSPESGAEYPSGWRVELTGATDLALEVVPEAAAAENRSRLVKGLFYWEGPVRVVGAAGQPAGEGYVELTGYGPGSRPPL